VFCGHAAVSAMRATLHVAWVAFGAEQGLELGQSLCMHAMQMGAFGVHGTVRVVGAQAVTQG